MDAIKNVTLGLFLAVLGFAAYANVARLGHLVGFASMVAVGTVAFVGAGVFFWSALRAP